MSLEPLHPGAGGLTSTPVEEGLRHSEPTVEWLSNYLSNAKKVQESVRELGFRRRVRVVAELGRIWLERLEGRALEGLKEELVKNTGYSSAMIENDLRLAGEVLKENNIELLIDSGLAGGWRSLDEFVEVAPGERLMNLPAGPVLIIASGNSVVPPLIPTVTSLVTGNVTILRPSLTNYRAVREVFRPLEDLAKVSEDASRLGEALVLTYLSHNSRVFEYLVKEAPVRIVNYWGGEPGRSVIARSVAENPHKPKLYVNGPLTGVAVVDGASAGSWVAEALAREVMMYDQQLCSSPTLALLIGDYGKAVELAREVSKHLDSYSSIHRIEVSEGWMFNLATLRKALELNGAKVIRSGSPENPYTVVVSRGRSSFTGLRLVPLNIHSRRRFLEIVAVSSIDECVELIRELPRTPGYAGIDGVQTIAIGVEDEGRRVEYIRRLSRAGVYRIVPLGESFLRTPYEPYDGEYIPRYFTYVLYFRGRRAELK
ncbi:MAG: acyl-CoA reductase [Zestosphaera sp.]